MNRDPRPFHPGRLARASGRICRPLAMTLIAFALASNARAVEVPNPFHGTQPATPPYTPDQRLVISDPQDGTILDHSPERVTVNFRRFDFEDLRPSSLELWIDGVEYTERLRFWTDAAWVDLPHDLLGPGEHQILASIRNASGSAYSNVAIISIFFGPCPGGCPWPISPTGQPHVVSNLMEDWQEFGYPPYFHSGIDIRTDSGTDVHACASGTVVKKVNYYGTDPLYWEVAIEDGTGLIWQYHHLDGTSITVSQGDSVAQGQVIGQVVEWTDFMNGERYNHLHLNTVRWQGSPPIANPYEDGWRYYNPLRFLTSGSYTDAVQPLEFDVYFGGNEFSTPFAAESDASDPVLSGNVDVLARLKDEMTAIGPTDTLGQPYKLGIYDLSWSANPLDTPCGMGWVPRTLLAHFDMLPGGTTTAGLEDALKKIYRQYLFYPGSLGASFDYNLQRFSYALTNTKNGFPDGVDGYWDTDKTISSGSAIHPDGHYVVKVYARDFYGNETVTSVPVTLSNNKTWNGICPPYIASLKVLQGPYLTTSSGGLYPALPIDAPLSFGPVTEGSAFATVESPSWSAWYFDLPDRGIRVAIGLLTGHQASVEYVPLLGDVIVTMDADVQVVPIGGVFDPNLPPAQPVSLRLSTRLARDPAGPALIGRPAAPSGTTFDLTMARTILVNGEPMIVRLGGGGADASWGLNPVAVESMPALDPRVAFRIEPRPNPLVAGGTLAITVDQDRNVEVDIHDSQGRRVRQVFKGSLPAGTHRLPWDARDESGDPLPAGIYFVRAWSDDAATLSKVVVMR